MNIDIDKQNEIKIWEIKVRRDKNFTPLTAENYYVYGFNRAQALKVFKEKIENLTPISIILCEQEFVDYLESYIPFVWQYPLINWKYGFKLKGLRKEILGYE